MRILLRFMFTRLDQGRNVLLLNLYTHVTIAARI